jgi:glycosyltransferase involved in cell wall biosynthesis
MLEEADLVFCVAKGLLRQVEPKRPDALYLPNGAEAERFAEPAGAAELAPEFLELASNGRPIAGYYGAIASWFDAELLAAAAALRSDWGFAVIGKTLSRTRALRALKKLSNVRVLGAQPYAALPHYLARFTAAMIPFRINRITEATSPIKLYEYFAGGKPVIATAMPECAAFPEVHIVRSAKELSTALDRAQEEEKDPAFRERMRAIGRRNSWSARVEAVEASLEACRERSGARPATRAALSPSVSLSGSRG